MIITLKGADFSANNIGNLVKLSRTIPLPSIAAAYTKASSSFNTETNKYRATSYGNVLAGDILEVINPDSTFNNRMVIYKVQDKESPMFVIPDTVKTSHSETYVSSLRDSYSSNSFTFDSNLRFLAVMYDSNDTNNNRDYTNYSFCLYNLRRKFDKGIATPIPAYHGTYQKDYNKILGYEKYRVFTVLDLKAGDVVASTMQDYKFDVYKLENHSLNYVSQPVREYKTTTWTSDAEQRVLIIAKHSTNGSESMEDVDPNSVFTVAFNS